MFSNYVELLLGIKDADVNVLLNTVSLEDTLHH
jgi:hypothetical protein